MLQLKTFEFLTIPVFKIWEFLFFLNIWEFQFLKIWQFQFLNIWQFQLRSLSWFWPLIRCTKICAQRGWNMKKIFKYSWIFQNVRIMYLMLQNMWCFYLSFKSIKPFSCADIWTLWRAEKDLSCIFPTTCSECWIVQIKKLGIHNQFVPCATDVQLSKQGKASQVKFSFKSPNQLVSP